MATAAVLCFEPTWALINRGDLFVNGRGGLACSKKVRLHSTCLGKSWGSGKMVA